MTGLESFGLMLVDKQIVAVRHTDSAYQLLFESLPTCGISLTAEQLKSENWEIGRECQKCCGSGEVSIPCPLCSGRPLQSLLEDPCCGGWDEIECPECGGLGIIWDNEY